MNMVKASDFPEFESMAKVAVPRDGHIGLRPESVALTTSGHTPIQGRIELVEALGAETLIYVRTERGAQFVARQNTRTPLHVGDRVGLSVDADAAHLFDAAGRITRTGAPAIPHAA